MEPSQPEQLNRQGLVPCRICFKYFPRTSLLKHRRTKHKNQNPPQHPSALGEQYKKPRHDDIDDTPSPYDSSMIDDTWSGSFDDDMLVDIDQPAGDGVNPPENLAFETELEFGSTIPYKTQIYDNAGLPSSTLDDESLQELTDQTYWPFANRIQWLFAKALSFPNRATDNMVKQLAVEKNCPWIIPGTGFQSVAHFRKLLDKLPRKGGEWRESYITRGPTAPVWAPETVPYWHRNSLETLKDMVGDVRLAAHMKWAPEKTYNAKGERIYSELWSGNWWPRIQAIIDLDLQHKTSDLPSTPSTSTSPPPPPPPPPESATIIPIILTSDKTHLAQSGKVKAWPLLMTIGNISNDVRFVPGQHCAQLIGFLPIIKGVEIHQASDEFRLWRRTLIHNVIRDVLAPIEAYMNTGIRLSCADGLERLCFPVLCEYVADMEEQWLLTCLKQNACMKCHVDDNEITPDSGAPLSYCTLNPNRIRTDLSMTQARQAHASSEITTQQLRALGAHPDKPFSAQYLLGGILDAVGPDLLHQNSKCWMDYVLKKQIFPLITHFWKGKAKESDVETEIDARFGLIPGYPNLRRFKNGIFTSNHHWTVHEYKEMMRVALGSLIGVCPPEGIRLIREYLHIHRLCYYSIHTEKSLEWLKSAITTYFETLTNPGNPWVRLGLLAEDYQLPPRLHYFLHYATTVMEKGALPSYSTDRTEIFHKPFKVAYKKSNKNGDAERIVLKETTRLTAFQNMVDSVDLMEASEAVDSGAGDDGVGKSQEETEGETSDEEDDIAAAREHEGNCSQPLISVTWSKSKIKTWSRRASIIEDAGKIPGFRITLAKYLQQSARYPTSMNDSNPNPRCLVYSNITLRYPSWITETEAPTQANPVVIDIGQGNGRTIIKEILRAGIGQSRQDCVLFKKTLVGRQHNGYQRNSMSFRRVGQLLLLFKCQWNDEWYNLAYISLFETRPMDKTSGLYPLRRTTKYAVIDVKDIERGVHLIPKFGHQVGETVKIQRQVGSVKLKFSSDGMTSASGGEATRAESQGSWLNVWSHYEEYWLNSWIDHHLYKTLYW